MPARRPVETLLALGATALAFAVALVWALGTGHNQTTSAAVAQGSWRGLVGESPTQVATAQREIVFLKTPSLAERVAAAAGGKATETQERAWTAAAYAAQRHVIGRLALDGITVRPDYRYARVVDGFAASLDPRAIVLLEHDAQVESIYPVRAAFPASLPARAAGGGVAPTPAQGPGAGLPGLTGHGVTIALLDTGVDLTHPYLGGRVLGGIDVVDHGVDASARSDPQDAAQVEQHGTELAGLLVGAGGPGGLHGVAPGATILPIRIAGWQADANGTDRIFARTDQLLAGLDRAVDPNDDGDAHDAPRIALVGVTEPYAAFADGPEARAVQGALALDMLVVAPAGNDGAAGPSFGSVGAPASAPGALAVAATDGRPVTPSVRVVFRRGIDVLLDRQLALAGAVAPVRAFTLAPAAPLVTPGGAIVFRDARGVSLVAGRVALAPAGNDPLAVARAAAAAGAAALVLYGDVLPAGSLRAVDGVGIPVVGVPAGPALALLAAQRQGIDVGVTLGEAASPPNDARGAVASFSSQGLAFDGRVKPNLAAPGVALETSRPGGRYGAITGTSAAAATVAGAAALLVEARPSLDGAALASLLAGYADPGTGVAATGAGSLDLGASAVGEVAAAPTSLAFGNWTGSDWQSTQTITVRNVSTRPLQVSLSSVSGDDAAALQLSIEPDQLVLPAGGSAEATITVSASSRPGPALVTGAVLVAPAGSGALRIPWAISFDRRTPELIAAASLDRSTFKPSDLGPAVLTVQAGSVSRPDGLLEVQPVARLDLLLYTRGGRFLGVLARLRDLLPGAYSFGITGRAPTSVPLAPGRYELRLVAWPTIPANARPARAKVPFTIR